MKVNQHHPLRPGQVEPREATRKSQETPAAAESTPATMTHLRQGSTDTSHDIDAARVDELRDAIRSGRLEIQPERIADGLIASVQDLLAEGSDRQ